MFVMVLAEVLLPILTDWGLPVRKSRSQSQRVGCKPSVDSLWVSLWGMTIESGAVVHKEHPDVGVFVFQVGEGIMEGSSDDV